MCPFDAHGPQTALATLAQRLQARRVYAHLHVIDTGDDSRPCRAHNERTAVHRPAAQPDYVVAMAHPKKRSHRPTAMPDLEPLNPDTALPLLRSSAWHPETVAAMLRHISDWLDGTGQFDAASHLRAISVADPVSGQATTVPDLVGAERSTMSRLEQAHRQARKDADLALWRAGRS